MLFIYEDNHMRYYIYISETKINQLYAQIPVKLRQKIASKFTIDLKLVKAEFEGRQPQEGLISMLEVVLSYLESEDLVGTVDNSKSYFKGTMNLSWGPYVDSGLVYFGGHTQATLVGLGGSLQHVIGEVGTSGAHSHSATPLLARALEKVTNSNAFGRQTDGANGRLLRSVELASGQMGGPWEPMEFVAKRLAHGSVARNPIWWWTGDYYVPDGSKYTLKKWEDIDVASVLLGSPLYVAMME
jgi:hypothetical protein